MRALYCTDTWLPQVNGVTVVTERSVRGLMARGWTVDVIAPRYPRPDMLSQTGVAVGGSSRVVVHSVPSVAAPRYPELRIAFPAPWRINAIVRNFAPDIVHCATEFTIGRVGMWAAARAGIPVVTSYHTDFGRYAQLYGFGRAGRWVEQYVGAMHRAAARTFTPSAAAKSALTRLDVSSVEVWGRGVDLATFRPDRRSADLRARLGLQGAFTFLYVGRLAREKSVHVVLKAFRLLTERLGHKTLRLVVAGSGPEELTLRELAPAGTVFLGNLDRDRELPALYATADAFAFASTTETLGLVVLEAMASGLPVIATPSGGVAEHLRDDVNGLAFPAGDIGALASAMHTMATTAGLRERLSAGAIETAGRLGWEDELDRLDAAYRDVCAQAREPRRLAAGLRLDKA
ncbi:MAG: glycosyltransferase family 1 protein [Gemmatimonadota bacterium]|nr:glycosyltransferase family 1 protein [Gemmatimonadota bacterium]